MKTRNGVICSLLLAIVLLAGCAGSGVSRNTPDYPSRGVVHWQDDQPQIPSALLNQIEASFLRLLAQSTVDSRLLISADPMPNAFATLSAGEPTVIINAGLIDMTGWDGDELAFVLGHELAHLELGHLDPERQQRLRTSNTLSDLLATVAGVVVPFGGLAVDIGHQLITTSFSRDQERDADQRGLELMFRSGFDPRGAVRFHRKLISVSGDSLLPFLSTHPSGEERIRRLEAYIAELATP